MILNLLDYLLDSFAVFCHCRKIFIPDVNPELFELFLGYLYSGVVDTDNMVVDRLMDLLALADKYEV